MKKFADLLSEMLETFTISLAIFLAIYAFLAFPEIVVGSSMEPALKNGERLLVERLTPKLNKLKRGDIIILNPPGNGNIDYVKRIVGLPGETLKITDCKVYRVENGVLGEPLEEGYLKENECSRVATEGFISIPEDSYYVLGDNRTQSADSRIFGPLKRESISGKVMVRFWPFNKMYYFE